MDSVTTSAKSMQRSSAVPQRVSDPAGLPDSDVGGHTRSENPPAVRDVASDGLSIVIPVYNSEESLVELCDRLHKALSHLVSDFEVILVNDASRDGSWETIRRLSAQHGWIRGLNLMRNYGQHNALLCGIRACRKPVVVTLDDDLQHPPEEIPRLLEKLQEGHDVVYGTPVRQRHGLLRDLASAITKLTLRGAMGVQVARDVSAFRAFRVQLREAFRDYRGTFVSVDVLLTWGTANFAAIPVRHDARRHGTSNYTVRRLITHAFNMLTGFSVLPLQIASLVGFAFTLFGGCVLVYVIGRYFLEGGSIAGFPFLASIIALFAGAQLFALGMIGEYLARMHFRMLERPSYTVAASTDSTVATMSDLGG